MIDHASVSVSDPVASKAFYEAALAPLGYRVVMEFGPVTGLGGPVPGAPEGAPVHADLWLEHFTRALERLVLHMPSIRVSTIGRDAVARGAVRRAALDVRNRYFEDSLAAAPVR